MGTTRHLRLEDLPRERVTEKLERRLVTGERLMLAEVFLREGCVVPRHAHEHEQLSYVLEGALRFRVGDGDEEVVVRGGEVLHLPSNVLHEAVALEDSRVADLFSPPRQDWLDGSDDYLRR